MFSALAWSDATNLLGQLSVMDQSFVTTAAQNHDWLSWQQSGLIFYEAVAAYSSVVAHGPLVNMLKFYITSAFIGKKIIHMS